MAATTSGWQCPVEVTAMPDEKSRNSLPSTSVMTKPRPCLATSGYDRVYDGEMMRSSPSSTRLAFGPGRAVLILGPSITDVVLVDMESSWKRSWVVGHWPGNFRRASTVHRLRRIKVNRYRRDWDGSATAAQLDSVAGTPAYATSKREGANWHSENA